MEVTKETELKLLIDRECYERLISLFPCIEPAVEQINYYFDTCFRYLSVSGVTLRIRHELSSYILCMKVKNSTESQLIASTEYSVSLSRSEFSEIIEKPEKMKDYFSVQAREILDNATNHSEPIMSLGCLKNERTVLKGLYNYKFEVDQTIFPDGSITYELEIEEVRPEHLDCLVNALKAQSITGVVNDRSKYQRFLEHISPNKV